MTTPSIDPTALTAAAETEIVGQDPFADIPDEWIGYTGLSEDDWFELAGGFARDMAKASIELGKLLLRKKRDSAHGAWKPFLERIDISQPTAWRHMANAAFAHKHPKLHQDLIGAKRSVRLEIAQLPDDVVKELEETGSAGGIRVSEIVSGNMTYQALRKRTAELEAERTKLLTMVGEQSKEIVELKIKAFDRAEKKPQAREAELLAEIQKHRTSVRAALGVLDRALEEVAVTAADSQAKTGRTPWSAAFEKEVVTLVEELEVLTAHTRARYRHLRGEAECDAVYAEIIDRAAVLPTDRRPATTLPFMERT